MFNTVCYVQYCVCAVLCAVLSTVCYVQYCVLGMSRSKSSKSSVKFIGEPVDTIKSKEYYSKVKIAGETLEVGSFVAVADEDRPEVNDIGKIEYMWKDSRGDAHLHVHWLT